MEAEWDIFLAHAGDDISVAEELYELLAPEARVFLDSKCLMLGDDWDRELAAAQQRSRVTIVLVSAQTDTAYYQREEIAAALDLTRKDASAHRLVPVYLEGGTDGTDVPYGLRLKHGLSVDQEGGLEQVAARLLVLLSKLATGLRKSTIAKSEGALKDLTAAKPRERFRGMSEVAGVYRPLQFTLLVILGVDVLLLAICVVAPGLDGLVDRGLAVSVLGAIAAGVLLSIMFVFQKSIELARVIVMGSVSTSATGHDVIDEAKLDSLQKTTRLIAIVTLVIFVLLIGVSAARLSTVRRAVVIAEQELADAEAALGNTEARLQGTRTELETLNQDLEERRRQLEALNELVGTMGQEDPGLARAATASLLEANPQAAGVLPRVYIHIRTEDQREPAAALSQALARASFVVPGTERLDVGPNNSELRYFHATEQEVADAERAAEVLRAAGLSIEPRFVPGFEDSTEIRTRHYELWLAPGFPIERR